MPSQSTANYGLKYGWTLGENGWNTDMDQNFITIDQKLKEIKDLTKRIVNWDLVSPADNYLTPPRMVRDSSSLQEIILIIDPVPASPVIFNILKNGSIVATATTAQQITSVTGVSFISGDILQAQINGAAQGITLGTIQLTIKNG